MTERGFGDSPSGDPGTGDTAGANRPADAGARPFGHFDFAGLLQIADSLPVMIAYADADEVYRFCNQSIADWFEQPRKAILGRKVREVMGERAYAARSEAIHAALSGERRFVAAEFIHPTRGLLFTKAEYVPQHAPDGSVNGVVMIVQDVTEQRAAELALKESEERFRRIANSAPAPMWVTRADASRDFVNQAYLDFFGFPPEKVGQHDWKRGLHPDDQAQLEAAYKAGLASGKPFDLEGRFRRADGEWRWLRSTSRPRLDGDGRVVGFIGVAADVTEEKAAQQALRHQVDASTAALEEAQDQLRQSQKMEALGQLTGGIAHDFNNLLTVIVGGLDLIVKRSDDDKVLRYARNALASAERGARLTAQLLAFSRVQRLEVKPARIADLLDEVEPLLRNVLTAGIERRLDIAPEPATVMADPTQVEVAILNLVINARDAMPDGGTLTIATRNVHVEDEPDLEPGDYTELAISDNGHGMPAEVQARAFEPFFTTKDIGKGTGLGLSMVYGMTRQSGGTARIHSVPGEGTTVSLWFRRVDQVADATVSASGAVPPAQAAKHQVKVLVVDDDPDVRSFLVSNLEEYGYSVDEASDGKRGLERFAAVAPDVVILDYLMPGMTGAEVAKRLLRQRPDQKILFVSGYSETDAITSAAPGATILHKPFRPEALDGAIRELIAG